MASQQPALPDQDRMEQVRGPAVCCPGREFDPADIGVPGSADIHIEKAGPELFGKLPVGAGVDREYGGTFSRLQDAAEDHAVIGSGAFAFPVRSAFQNTEHLPDGV